MGYRGPRLELLFDPDDAQRTAREIAKEMGQVMTDETRRIMPRDPNTPPGQHIADHIYQSPVRKRGRLYTTGAQTDDERAVYVEYDTRPHWIHPKKPGGTLAFPGSGAKTVFAKVVYHPGTRGQHVFLRGAAHADALLPRIAAWHTQAMVARIESRMRRAGSRSTYGRRVL